MDVILSTDNISKSYGDNLAVSALCLNLIEGEFFSLIGPSGSGKSTLLKMLAGVEQPTVGRVFYRDKEIDYSQSWRSDIVMVWQSLALFPHMTVAKNIAFGLRVRHTASNEIKERVTEVLSTVGLSGLENRMPTELSGGELQRVALARALVVRPKVLLLDEPFGALDIHLRKKLRGELQRLHKKTGLTVLMVTHDQDDAVALSSRVGIMNAGLLEQVGTPAEIDRAPATIFVASFFGNKNVIEGTLAGCKDGKVIVKTNIGTLYCERISHADMPLAIGSHVACVVDASAIQPDTVGNNVVKGTVLSMIPRGSIQLVSLEIHETGATIQCVIPTGKTVAEGDNLTVSWHSRDSYIIFMKV